MAGSTARHFFALAFVSFVLWAGVPQSAVAQATFEESKIEAFVAAAIEIDRLLESWVPRIEAAEGEEREALTEEANALLVKAIENTEGISIEEYRAINEAAQQDAELNQRIGGLYERKLAE